MRLQLEILSSTLKKEWVWMLILVILTMIELILCMFNVNGGINFKTEFLSLIGTPGLTNYNFTTLLIAVYQIGLIIYYVYVYYTYELKSSFENVILRANEKRWIRNKVFVSFIFTIVFKAVYEFFVYLFFSNEVSLKLYYFVYPVLFQMLLSLVIITLNNFFKRRNFIAYVLVTILGLLFFKWFNFVICITFIIVLLIMNICFFHFKTYYFNQVKR